MVEYTKGPTKGSLLIHGGNIVYPDFKDLFSKLGGGPQAAFVCIPTALADAKLGDSLINAFGFINPIRLHTRDPNEANEESFVKPLLTADAVFIDGGRQPRLADSYLNTRTHTELQRLLDRGGVIAGSSAGATILGSFLVRGQGEPDFDNKKVIGDHQEGFGFIQGIAIDQHISQLSRKHDLEQVLKLQPDLLGVGIDEDTGIHVVGDVFTVLDIKKVFIHDGSGSYIKLTKGQKYDMAKRAVVS